MTSIEIYNFLGEKVYTEEQNNAGVIEIERANLERGEYFYKIMNCETLQIVEGKVFIENSLTVQSARKLNDILKRKFFRLYFYFRNVFQPLHLQSR